MLKNSDAGVGGSQVDSHSRFADSHYVCCLMELKAIKWTRYLTSNGCLSWMNEVSVKPEFSTGFAYRRKRKLWAALLAWSIGGQYNCSRVAKYKLFGLLFRKILKYRQDLNNRLFLWSLFVKVNVCLWVCIHICSLCIPELMEGYRLNSSRGPLSSQAGFQLVRWGKFWAPG